MTLREKIEAAIGTAKERNDDPERDDVDVAADAVMGLLGPVIQAAMARRDDLAPRFHRTPTGAEYYRCPSCGEQVAVPADFPHESLGEIRHAPNCTYMTLDDILDVF